MMRVCYSFQIKTAGLKLRYSDGPRGWWFWFEVYLDLFLRSPSHCLALLTWPLLPVSGLAGWTLATYPTRDLRWLYCIEIAYVDVIEFGAFDWHLDGLNLIFRFDPFTLNRPPKLSPLSFLLLPILQPPPSVHRPRLLNLVCGVSVSLCFSSSLGFVCLFCESHVSFESEVRGSTCVERFHRRNEVISRDSKLVHRPTSIKIASLPNPYAGPRVISKVETFTVAIDDGEHTLQLFLSLVRVNGWEKKEKKKSSHNELRLLIIGKVKKKKTYLIFETSQRKETIMSLANWLGGLSD